MVGRAAHGSDVCVQDNSSTAHPSACRKSGRKYANQEPHESWIWWLLILLHFFGSLVKWRSAVYYIVWASLVVILVQPQKKRLFWLNNKLQTKGWRNMLTEKSTRKREKSNISTSNLRKIFWFEQSTKYSRSPRESRRSCLHSENRIVRSNDPLVPDSAKAGLRWNESFKDQRYSSPEFFTSSRMNPIDERRCEIRDFSQCGGWTWLAQPREISTSAPDCSPCNAPGFRWERSCFASRILFKTPSLSVSSPFLSVNQK